MGDAGSFKELHDNPDSKLSLQGILNHVAGTLRVLKSTGWIFK